MASGFRAFPILRTWRVYLPTGFDFRAKSPLECGRLELRWRPSFRPFYFSQCGGWSGLYFPKLLVSIEDNHNYTYGKWHRTVNSACSVANWTTLEIKIVSTFLLARKFVSTLREKSFARQIIWNFTVFSCGAKYLWEWGRGGISLLMALKTVTTVPR